jgi:hypothetical protein
MKQRCKHTFPSIEKLCFLHGKCKVVIKKSSVESRRESNFERPTYRDMSLGAEELN